MIQHAWLSYVDVKACAKVAEQISAHVPLTFFCFFIGARAMQQFPDSFEALTGRSKVRA
jgi:hypothetical protein